MLAAGSLLKALLLRLEPKDALRAGRSPCPSPPHSQVRQSEAADPKVPGASTPPALPRPARPCLLTALPCAWHGLGTLPGTTRPRHSEGSLNANQTQLTECSRAFGFARARLAAGKNGFLRILKNGLFGPRDRSGRWFRKLGPTPEGQVLLPHRTAGRRHGGNSAGSLRQGPPLFPKRGPSHKHPDGLWGASAGTELGRPWKRS